MVGQADDELGAPAAAARPDVEVVEDVLAHVSVCLGRQRQLIVAPLARTPLLRLAWADELRHLAAHAVAAHDDAWLAVEPLAKAHTARGEIHVARRVARAVLELHARRFGRPDELDGEQVSVDAQQRLAVALSASIRKATGHHGNQRGLQIIVGANLCEHRTATCAERQVDALARVDDHLVLRALLTHAHAMAALLQTQATAAPTGPRRTRSRRRTPCCARHRDAVWEGSRGDKLPPRNMHHGSPHGKSRDVIGAKAAKCAARLSQLPTPTVLRLARFRPGRRRRLRLSRLRCITVRLQLTRARARSGPLHCADSCPGGHGMCVPGWKAASFAMSARALDRMLARKRSTSKSTASPPNGSASATAHSLRPCST